MKNSQKTITICASAFFYKEVLEIEKTLKRLGFKILIPVTAKRMKKSGDFNVANYKIWEKTGDYTRKTYLMNEHFKKVLLADAILVINNKKNEIYGYIGGNVLMEMVLAFHYKKPIFILNSISDTLSIQEEVYGLRPIFLQGNIQNLPKNLR